MRFETPHAMIENIGLVVLIIFLAAATILVIAMMETVFEKKRHKDISAAELAARKQWLDYGPCAPQCNAECDGYCTSTYQKVRDK